MPVGVRYIFIAVASMLWAPTTASAGAWTIEEGVLWSKVAVFHLSSDRIWVDRVRADGEVCNGTRLQVGQIAPLDCTLENGGRFRATQLFLEAALGVHERVDVRLQLPVVLDAQFDAGPTAVRRTFELGDVRLASQVLLLADPLVWSFNVEAKAPTGIFVRDAIGAPPGEGQWDVTLRTLVSKSLFGGPLWVGAELGYRVRFPNSELGLDGLNIGDELLGVVEGGYRAVPWLYLPLRIELQWGFPSSEIGAGEGLRDRAGRRFVNLQTGIMVNPLAGTQGDMSDLGIELGFRYPLYAEGWLADPVYFAGISGAFDVFASPR